MAAAGKPSKAEGLKVASAYLRGMIAEEFAEPSSHVGDESSTLLKFHGTYQQDDRDVRTARKKAGEERDYGFMIRTRVPGGKLTAAQYLAHDRLAREVGNGTIRITTRQEFQLHGVLKTDLKAAMRAINEALLTTLAACGDVERNVLSCPAPLVDGGVRAQMQADCDAFAAHLAPRASSYWDIWLDGEKVEDPDFPSPGPALVPTPGDDAVEPIYGKSYMPRKFKTAFALPEDNCTDIYSNDLGYLAVVEDGELVGYEVLVGGGLGTTPAATKTFPALAKPLAFVPRADFLRVGEAVVKVQRDFGNRSDRKRARLKYLIHDLGMPAFRAKVEEYLDTLLAKPRGLTVTEVHDHLGWTEQGDGRLMLGLPVDCGRIKDDGPIRLMSGLREFFERYGTRGRLTCSQSILLVDIDPAWRVDIESWLEAYGIATIERISTVRRWAMACPALPTCGLAVTEAERAFPDLMAGFEAELDDLGLDDERFTVRMTGCPNGCARPYNSDVGLVGRQASKTDEGGNTAGSYTIFLGGSTLGERLNVLFKDYVPFDKIVPELAPVLRRFRDERQPGERLGDYCVRAGLAVEPTEDEESKPD